MELVRMEEYENIYRVDVFEKEFRDLFGKSSAEARRYQNWLDTKLHILDQEGVEAVDGVTFKPIHGHKNLYEIRYNKSQANPRVIYCIFSEEGAIILLSATKEKSKSDISHAADVADGRLKIIMEE